MNAAQDNLINASRNGDLEVVQALLAANADVNAENVQGYTASAIASQKGQREIVRLLEPSSSPTDK